MQYQKNINFSGSISRAIEFLYGTFKPLGFSICNMSTTSIDVVGSGLKNSKENPLLGFSSILFLFQNSQVIVKAELGGILKLQKALMIFMAVFELLFILGFGYFWWTIPSLKNKPYLWLCVILPFSPWYLILPLMFRKLEEKTKNSLEALLITMETFAKK